jgi:hypothetical protein
LVSDDRWAAGSYARATEAQNATSTRTIANEAEDSMVQCSLISSLMTATPLKIQPKNVQVLINAMMIRISANVPGNRMMKPIIILPFGLRPNVPMKSLAVVHAGMIGHCGVAPAKRSHPGFINQ